MHASLDDPRGEAPTSPASSGTPPPELIPPSRSELDPLLERALAEDLGSGDVTSDTVVPGDLRARGTLLARADGVLAGLDVFRRTFELLDPALDETRREARDGQAVSAGQRLLVLEGGARALLAGERTALNLIQRLSGIATLTRRYVEQVAGRAAVLDTRKTTPGLRVLEKYAVRCGGGTNHRTGLFDQAMVKNNHVDLTGEGPGALARRIHAARGRDLLVTAEARDLDEALEALAGGADVILLDNFRPAELAPVVERLRAEAASSGTTILLEASGGVTADTVEAFAATGVDRISVGELTHSAPALDLAFRLERIG